MKSLKKIRARLLSNTTKRRVKCKGCGYVSYVYKFDLMRRLAFCTNCKTVFTWEDT